MITGHLGIALALRVLVTRKDPVEPRQWVLPALAVAAVLPDVADLAYAAADFCSPFGLYSHAIAPLVTLAVLAFGIGFVVFTNAKVGALLALAVFSHLAADFVTGEKMLWAGGPIVGLVMYRYPIVDFMIEVPILTAGWWILRRTSNARQAFPWATSTIALVTLIVMQGAMDFAKLRGEKVKPNACEEMPLRVR